jgi:hypothetical protein
MPLATLDDLASQAVPLFCGGLIAPPASIVHNSSWTIDQFS